MGRAFAGRCVLALLIALGISVDEVSGQNISVETNGSGEALDSLAQTDGTGTTNASDMDLNMTFGDFNGTNITAPTQAPTIPTLPPTTEDGCYTSLDAIYYVISDDDKLFEQKRFVLCPGTTVDVGFLVPGIGIDKGQTPLVPRSNTELLCGEDGKAENNCIIRGGDFGAIAVPVFFRQDLAVNNVQIRGFTFVDQVQYSVFIASSGLVDLYDCIFRDSANFGTIVYNFDSSLDFGRRLEEEEYLNPWDAVIDYVERYRSGTLPKRLASEEEVDSALLPKNSPGHEYHQRGLQSDVFQSLIKDCLFSNQQQVERKLGVEFGVVTVKGPDHIVAIEDCTFANNQYGNQELTPIGYGVLIQGAEVRMKGNCFIDNDFRGNGAVLLEQTKDPLAPGADFLYANYATEGDADLDCPFAAYFETDEDRKNSTFTCVPIQAEECGGEHISTPPPSPAPDSSGPSGLLLSPLALLAGFVFAVL